MNTHQSEEPSEPLQHRLRGRSQPAEQPAAGATNNFHIPAAAAPTASLQAKPPTYLSSPTPSLEETTMRRQQAQGRRPHTARPAPSPRRPRRGISTDPSPLRHSDEKEPDLGKPKSQARRHRSHEDDGAGHARPHPIYTPDAQIRGSPTLPPPERTEKGRGTRGGAGENGRKTKSLSQSPLSTVAEGRDKRAGRAMRKPRL
jgi:hypothetical protein